MSFESEESFALHPASTDVDPGPSPSTTNTSYSFIHVPYLSVSKASQSRYTDYASLDFKVPGWLGLPATFQSVAGESDGDYGNVLISTAASLSTSTSERGVAMLQWPDLVLEGFGATYCDWGYGYDPVPEVYPSYSSTSSVPSPVFYSSPLHFQQELATFSMQASCPPQSSASTAESVEELYLPLPVDLFPVRFNMRPRETPDRQ